MSELAETGYRPDANLGPAWWFLFVCAVISLFVGGIWLAEWSNQHVVPFYAPFAVGILTYLAFQASLWVWGKFIEYKIPVSPEQNEIDPNQMENFSKRNRFFWINIFVLPFLLAVAWLLFSQKMTSYCNGSIQEVDSDEAFFTALIGVTLLSYIFHTVRDLISSKVLK